TDPGRSQVHRRGPGHAFLKQLFQKVIRAVENLNAIGTIKFRSAFRAFSETLAEIAFRPESASIRTDGLSLRAFWRRADSSRRPREYLSTGPDRTSLQGWPESRRADNGRDTKHL